MIQAYKEMLKTHRLSVTSVRLVVLQALESYPHSQADQIFRIVSSKISTVSKQAIYNNLNTLVEHGLIREIKPKGQPSLFETRVGDNHHHIVCRKCGAVMDTDCPDVAPCLNPKDSKGFVIDEAEIVFWGICPDCQTSKKKIGENHEQRKR